MASQFVQKTLNQIDIYLEGEDNFITKSLDFVEKKTNVKKRYVAFGKSIYNKQSYEVLNPLFYL